MCQPLRAMVSTIRSLLMRLEDPFCPLGFKQMLIAVNNIGSEALYRLDLMDHKPAESTSKNLNPCLYHERDANLTSINITNSEHWCGHTREGYDTNPWVNSALVRYPGSMNLSSFKDGWANRIRSWYCKPDLEDGI